MILYRIEYKTRDNHTASQNGCLGVKPDDANIQDVLNNQTLFVERNWTEYSFWLEYREELK